jgi:hypothetical protein
MYIRLLFHHPVWPSKIKCCSVSVMSLGSKGNRV